MLIATLIIATVAMTRRWFARRSPRGKSDRRDTPGSGRRGWRRPLPVTATLLALLGVAVVSGTPAQC
ncbi:hypothetical protein [Nocardia arthritidis]|uniref:hypothetical protein n=1 Tax=Nocardia arthritidis TaxID=228602 RepID=UPI0007A4DB36|nr:hypothetical protein [Nocardia arthritidis]